MGKMLEKIVVNVEERASYVQEYTEQIKQGYNSEVIEAKFDETIVMKFVVLVLLFAVGCQSESLLDFTAAEYLRSAHILFSWSLDLYKRRVEGIVKNVEDEAVKTTILTQANSIHDQIIELQAQVKPFTTRVVETIDDATKDLRANIKAKVEALKEEFEPMRAELETVLREHEKEYEPLLGPLMDELNKKRD
ncbi:hypothetical protein WMY93_029314 [Mugilogobius chulae]|uniref:Apolipoprotein A-I n=1 Tax=Mugilogobius chulae TaxID=88201 RepID=A0AAW0MSM1_9GOBI